MIARRTRHRVLVWLAVGACLAACSRGQGAPGAPSPQAPGSADPPPLQVAAPLASTLQSVGDCNIEVLNRRLLEGGTLQVDQFSDFVVDGWAIDAEHRTIGSPLRLHVTDLASGREWQTVPARRTPRPDVVASRGGALARAWVYDDAGFQAIIPVDALAPGHYGLAVVIGSGRRTARLRRVHAVRSGALTAWIASIQVHAIVG